MSKGSAIILSGTGISPWGIPAPSISEATASKGYRPTKSAPPLVDRVPMQPERQVRERRTSHTLMHDAIEVDHWKFGEKVFMFS